MIDFMRYDVKIYYGFGNAIIYFSKGLNDEVVVSVWSCRAFDNTGSIKYLLIVSTVRASASLFPSEITSDLKNSFVVCNNNEVCRVLICR